MIQREKKSSSGFISKLASKETITMTMKVTFPSSPEHSGGVKEVY